MSDTNHVSINCVQSLFDTLVDVSEGYEELVQRADTSIRGLIRDMADQHEKDIAEIDKTAKRCGIELDNSGTLMSDVQKVVVKFRDHVSKLGPNVLEAIAGGEETVVKRYDSAIKDLPEDHELHTVLTRQRQTLRSKIGDLFSAA